MLAMTRAEFEELVADALDRIPAELSRMMHNVVVMVEDDGPPGLLGLYEGVPLTERGDAWAAGSLPDRITIYRNSILAVCETREDAGRQVWITVAHEIAHHFGISDDRLHELGWG